MHVLSHWPDEAAFSAADPARRSSAKVHFGATWRRAGSNDAWRLCWVLDTGELYVCRADGYDGSCTDVSVIAVLRSERAVDAVLEGWRDLRTDPDGLSWLEDRLALLAGSARAVA